MPQGDLLRLLVHAPGQIFRHFPRQAGAQGYDALMVFLQCLPVHPGLVVITVHKTDGDDFHQILIALVVLRQQHQMIVPVIPVTGFPVKPGAGGHIDLASQNRIDPLLFCLLVKVDDAVHHAVIRDGCRSHAQFLYPGDILFDFIGTVQKTVFRMCVQMDKRHVLPPLRLFPLRLFPLRCTCCVR